MNRTVNIFGDKDLLKGLWPTCWELGLAGLGWLTNNGWEPDSYLSGAYSLEGSQGATGLPSMTETWSSSVREGWQEASGRVSAHGRGQRQEGQKMCPFFLLRLLSIWAATIMCCPLWGRVFSIIIIWRNNCTHHLRDVPLIWYRISEVDNQGTQHTILLQLPSWHHLPLK